MAEKPTSTECKYRIYLSLGSNLGNRTSNLEKALHSLSPLVDVVNQSSIYETEPWGVLDQPNFLNQVLEGETNLSPSELLEHVKGIEREMGRKPSRRFGPRLVDIDILFYGDQIISEDGLTIPHKRMSERAFVLIPLKEIAPDLLYPGSPQTINDLASGVDPTGVVLYKEDNG
jgi:2-amino-4-hydroxy-6-hydroxymethyldihydropteridine diphosphokinase